ncbi:hypothetical protein [Sphingomonas adhaesiva]|uniref:hypothetical protein n=1 Tax=Sphingomonas adhaesiva TaxID=28212 RepID=UPI002FF88144
MKKIVVALTAATLALTLAACDRASDINAAAANDAAFNDTIVTDEEPADANLSATGNGADIAPRRPAGRSERDRPRQRIVIRFAPTGGAHRNRLECSLDEPGPGNPLAGLFLVRAGTRVSSIRPGLAQDRCEPFFCSPAQAGVQ